MMVVTSPVKAILVGRAMVDTVMTYFVMGVKCKLHV
jgi:hypothetical protein